MMKYGVSNPFTEIRSLDSVLALLLTSQLKVNKLLHVSGPQLDCIRDVKML